MASRRLLLMNTRKHIALIAHDNRKHALLAWARCNRNILLHHDLFATGTTGAILSADLGLDITRFASGPLGGDQLVRWVQPVPLERTQTDPLPTELLMPEPRQIS